MRVFRLWVPPQYVNRFEQAHQRHGESHLPTPHGTTVLAVAQDSPLLGI
jgi:hypothetical protein